MYWADKQHLDKNSKKPKLSLEELRKTKPQHYETFIFVFHKLLGMYYNEYVEDTGDSCGFERFIEICEGMVDEGILKLICTREDKNEKIFQLEIFNATFDEKIILPYTFTIK